VGGGKIESKKREAMNQYIKMCNKTLTVLKANLTKKDIKLAKEVLSSYGEHYCWHLVVVNRHQIKEIVRLAATLGLQKNDYTEYEFVVLLALCIYYVNGAKSLLKNLDKNFNIEFGSTEVDVMISAAETFVYARHELAGSLPL